MSGLAEVSPELTEGIARGEFGVTEARPDTGLTDIASM